ncbi:hypothetical protein QJS04_geneDACA014345 [Acorus gramineus]|uniref:Uncharacterized protein n=1 Tax=Acorus gramineus TaxID=55184 RepID=A0AAV9AKE2_ACOGR|nr:hypothetical protein QJS04_geneDACA014345 [Acorus gramineus]
MENHSSAWWMLEACEVKVQYEIYVLAKGGQLDDDDDVEVNQADEVEGNEEVCEGGAVVNEEEGSDDHDNCVSEDEYRSIISDSDDSVSDYEGGGDFVAVDEENPHIKVDALFANVKQYRIALKQWCIKEEFAVVYDKNEPKRVTARVWDGREKAIRQIYGDPKDSFLLVLELQEEIKKSNPRSIVHYIVFEGCVSALRECDGGAAAWLDGVNSMVWSRCKFGTTANCHYLTNNLSESFNAWVSDIRGCQLIYLVDGLRLKLMVRMDQRRHQASRWKGRLVPHVRKYLQDILKDLGAYIVKRSTDMRAEVTGTEFRCDNLHTLKGDQILRGTHTQGSTSMETGQGQGGDRPPTTANSRQIFRRPRFVDPSTTGGTTFGSFNIGRGRGNRGRRCNRGKGSATTK